MDAKLAGSEVRMSDLMDTKLAASNQSLKQEIMEGFNVVIEDKVSKEIRLIAEQYGDLVKRLEIVTAKHTGEIQKLQRA